MALSQSALRKAAIVIDALDPFQADALLDQMPRDQAERIRQAVMDLSEPPDEEREEVLRQFLHHSGRTPSSSPIEDSVEIAGSMAKRLAGAYDASPPAAGKQEGEDAPFGFLPQVDDESLASLLAAEHPQTAALVISNLPPDRSISVLRCFEQAARAEVLRRLSVLDKTDPAIIEDVAAEIRLALQDRLQPAPSDAGKAAVRNLLHAADEQERRQMMELLGWETEDTDTPWQRDSLSETVSDDAAPAPQYCWFEKFDDLCMLDDDGMSAVLQRARPVVAVLALAGAGPVMTNKVFGQLSKADNEAMVKQLNALEPFPLRDIALAQAEMVELANRLANEEEIRPPSSRPMAA